MTEIPRTIHRLWLGGQEPDWTRPFADTWVRGDWELESWDDRRVEDELFPLANQAVYEAAPEIAPDHVGQLRSDVLRYEILLRRGGVWVDTDFQCLRDIGPLIEGASAFLSWVVKPVWVNNAIMGAEAGHPFLQDLVDGLRGNVEANLGYKPNVLTGPWYATPCYRRHSDEVLALEEELFYPFKWDEVESFDPDEVDPSEQWPLAFAVHWWGNKRREKGIG